ncbi:MAG: hypothetical protein IPN69_03760 [Acidobacteria bacterium]|nr:hypothetical protein [Acidobacteriota bacterium]MBK8149706.1 hypothetical protein [Acidobacteriota bacterium]MBK8809831.1 hypothetical protein [Acidobacteriota bacterium]
MINHISVGVENPENVANVMAELWNGYAFPFPPSPGGFIVFADDGRGSAVEFVPANIELIPGNGFPSDENFSIETPTEEFEGTFQFAPTSPKYVSVHLAVNSPLSVSEVQAIADREGWRVMKANRGGGLFQLIEVWVENRFMIEVFTPEMTARYVEIATPQNWANFIQAPFEIRPERANNLNLIG